MKLFKDLFKLSELLHHNDEKEMKTCGACEEVIELHSPYYYISSPNSLLHNYHKSCVELPLQITYPFHPEQTLNLTSCDDSVKSSCNFCKRSAAGRRAYRCKDCIEFYVDLVCGTDATLRLLASKSIEERERTTLKDLHHDHDHQLTLITIPSPREDDYEDEDDDKEDVAVIQNCKACLQPIVDSTYYICTEESEGCKDYYLHRFCGELPAEMKHELHPLHSLFLMLAPPLEHFKCFVCRRFCQGPIYSCRTCSFQLDIVCATLRSRVLEHKGHQHPLTLLPISNSSLFCSACCKVHAEGMHYQCNTCVGFFIHQDCASLEYVTAHSSHRGHPLRLEYHLDGSQGRKFCDICDEIIHDQTGWFYYCWECKFYAHLSCMQYENNRKAQEIDPKIPCLPWEETDNEFGTVGLLNRNLTSTDNRFIHPDHPLVLHIDVPREANSYSVGKITLKTRCNGCCMLISAPLYSCVKCNFYIHKACAELPHSIAQLHPTSIAQHRDHSKHAQCSLVLLREPWSETRSFYCSNCRQYCNGFSYQCEVASCSYKIDVECAFLPRQIVHKAHPFHTLSLGSLFNTKVKCCSDKTGTHAYKCDKCTFAIHARCAMYPGRVHHRFDSDSPFMLSFDPSHIEPNEYNYCDICEDILDPKKWYYFSSKMGGLIMHSRCLLHGDRVAVKNRKFKSVSSLVIEVDKHPHLLHFYPICGGLEFYNCNHCKRHTEYGEFAYQCVEWGCNYKIHATCANKLLLVQEEEDTQPSINTQDMINLYLQGTGRGRGNLVTVISKEMVGVVAKEILLL